MKINKQMRNDRLTTLANFLKTVPKQRFDFTRWVGKSYQGKADLSCGTTACAVGWATTIPTFRQLGLFLQRSSLAGNYRPCYYNAEDYGNELNGDCAVQHFFKLNEDEIVFLFYPHFTKPASNPRSCLSEKATPKQVAKRIECFIKHDGVYRVR